MIAGFDRYFQIAPCFRDEDARADRSPGEFYQLDVEMSFVTQDDVFAAIEPVMRGTFEEFANGKPVTPKFPLIPFADAMRKYGTDQAGPAQSYQHAERQRGVPRLGLQDLREHSGREPKNEGVGHPGRRAAATAHSADRMNSWAQGEGPAGASGYIFWREGEEGGAGPLATQRWAGAHEARFADQSRLASADAGVFFVAGQTGQGLS
jgi:aspartyl-tRNA synthetase